MPTLDISRSNFVQFLGKTRAKQASQNMRKFPLPKNKATTGELYASAFRREHLLVALGSYMNNFRTFVPLEGFDPFQDEEVTTTFREELLDGTFDDVRSPEELEFTKNRILTERRDREIIQQAGWRGFVATMAAGATSPENFLIAGVAMRTLRTMKTANSFRQGGVVALEGFAASSIAEVGLQSLQQTRTAKETFYNISGATLLSGVLGTGVAAIRSSLRAPLAKMMEDEFVKGREVAKEVLEEIEGAKGGFERFNGDTSKFEDEFLRLVSERDPDGAGDLIKFGRAKRAISSIIRTPAVRAILSRSKVMRLSMAKLSNTRFLRNINLQGETLGAPVESMVLRWQVNGAGLRMRTRDAFKRYRSRIKGDRNIKDFNEFKGLLAKMLRRRNTSPLTEEGLPLDGVRELQDAAGDIRQYFDQIRDEAVSVGLISKADLDLKGTADSWLWRAYDVEKIIASLSEELPEKNFRKIIAQYIFDNQDPRVTGTLTRAQADRRANDVINNIRGHDFGKIPLEIMPERAIGEASSLKDRLLLIRDEHIEDFLINDIEVIIDHVSNTLPPRIEMARAFSPTPTGSISRLSDKAESVSEKAAKGQELHRVSDLANELNDLRAARRLTSNGQRKDAERLTSLVAQRNQLREQFVATETRLNTGFETLELKTKLSKIREDLSENGKKVFALRQEAKKFELHPDEIKLKVKTVGRREDQAKLIDETKKLQTQADALRREEALDGQDMTFIIREVQEEFNELRAKERPTGISKTLFDRDEKNSLADIELVRSRILGITGRKADPSTMGFALKLANVARALNVFRAGGQFAISSIPDLGMNIFVNGLSPTFRTYISVLRDPRLLVGMKRGELQKLVGAMETVMGTRAGRIADTLGPDPVTGIEEFLRRGQDYFFKLNGLNYWNSTMKQVASLTAADELIKNSIKWSKGTIGTKARTAMAASGVDRKSAIRIAKQWDELKGEKTSGGLTLARSEEWTDEVAKRSFENAVLSNVENVIVTPSAADLPRIFSAPFLRIFGQFRSFAFSASQKVFMSGLQRLDAETAMGAMAMVAMGTVVVRLTNALRNSGKAKKDRQPLPESTQEWLVEAIDRSGLLGILPEFNGFIERFSSGKIGINPMVSGKTTRRFRPRDWQEIMLGPSVGLADRFFQVGTAPFKDSGVTQGDVRAMRRILPLNNLFYMRWLFNNMESGFNDAMGIPTAEEARRRAR